MSTFAATTCSSVADQATLRENDVRRGSTAWIVPACSSGRCATATQSPTAGRSPKPSASYGEPAGRLGADLALLDEDDVGAAMLFRHPPGNEAGGGVRFEVMRVAVSPAEFFQRGQACLLERRVGAGARASLRAARLREMPEV